MRSGPRGRATLVLLTSSAYGPPTPTFPLKSGLLNNKPHTAGGGRGGGQSTLGKRAWKGREKQRERERERERERSHEQPYLM